MSVISIQVLFAGPAIPAGVTRASTTVLVTDSAGASQSATLTGTEVPVGFIPSVTVAAGAGTILLTDTDTNGAVIGTPTGPLPFTTGSVTGSVLQSSGVTVVTITP
jgi:hypothetical protein